MRILVLFNNTFPLGMAMTNRLNLYSKALISQKASITIACCKINSSSNTSIKNENGILYYDVPRILNYKSSIHNYFHSFSKTKIIKNHLSSVINKYDVVWIVGQFPINTIYKILNIVKRYNKKSVIELNEFPYALVTSRTQNAYFNSLKRYILFNTIYKKINGFVVISEKLKTLVSKYKDENSKIIKIPILIDSRKYKLEHNTVKERYSEKIIFHAGTLTDYKDGILSVFESVCKYINEKDQSVKFILSNKKTYPEIFQKIMSIINKYNVVGNVIFHDHLNKDELEKYLKKCSCTIINKPLNRKNSYNFSTKLGEYMSFGVPVICTIIGEASNFTIDNQNCFIISENNKKEIFSKLDTVFSNPQASIAIGNEGYNTARENFDYNIYAEKLINFFKDLN